MVNEEGLSTIRQSLEADGYLLDVREDGERLDARVSAGPDAVRVTVLVSGAENPTPGSDGTTTSKDRRGSPPWAAGSVSGPITSRKSQKVHGQPCVSTSGWGSGPAPRTWTKWIGIASIVTSAG